MEDAGAKAAISDTDESAAETRLCHTACCTPASQGQQDGAVTRTTGWDPWAGWVSDSWRLTWTMATTQASHTPGNGLNTCSGAHPREEEELKTLQSTGTREPSAFLPLHSVAFKAS